MSSLGCKGMIWKIELFDQPINTVQLSLLNNRFVGLIT